MIRTTEVLEDDVNLHLIECETYYVKCVFGMFVITYPTLTTGYFYKMSNQGMLIFSKLVIQIKLRSIGKKTPLVINESKNK